jgi:hypothetical protein
MPKIVIDYSNTIIYKITCKDPTVKDVYVGHTTNFVQRKHAHKNASCNEKPNDCKLYQAIRNNGGWNNWNMEIVNFFNCKDHYEARKKEQEYFELLNATLNSIEPMPKPKFKHEPKVEQIKQEEQVRIDTTTSSISKKYSCELCNYFTSDTKDLNKHKATRKHILRTTIENGNVANEINKKKNYCCENCNFKSTNKTNYAKHISTMKHISENNLTNKNTCNLLKHTKNCQVLENKTELTNELREHDVKLPFLTAEMFLDLMKQNKDLQNCLMESHNKILELSNYREALIEPDRI